MRALLLAILGVLVLELWLLVWLSQHIGAWSLFGLLLIGGTLGAGLAKRRGLRVFRDWQAALASGQPPREGALEGILVLVSGMLFLLPGLISDVLGLALLFAPVRRRLAKALRPLFGVQDLMSFAAGAARPGGVVSPGRSRPARGNARWDDGARVVETEGEAVQDPHDDEDDHAPRQLH
ncbi:MAG: rane protein FxsA-like [Pseudomonadota bacterium]|jgi:UPF0716 protein FxsA